MRHGLKPFANQSTFIGDPVKKLASLTFALLIGFSGAAFAQAKADASKAPAAAKADAAKDAPKAAEAKKELIDINSATEAELATLPKIGEARSKAIVKGRPYGGKDDLLKKKIIPKDAYEAVKDLVIAKQAPKAEKSEMKKDAKKDEMKKEEKKK
jgi:DNA uptake protein ComE-like DNA-binding protein